MAEPNQDPTTPRKHAPPSLFTFAPRPRSPEWPGTGTNMGSESPRSKVARHFHALDLDGAGGGGGGGGATCGGGAQSPPSPRQPPASAQ
ncbi:hypothetical protein IMZ48_23540, partial [Candidatus Bathyarchaeota archaeon]|nr:hypothetical protein [Candidatus Bathyarchaeota archaeon]